MKFRSIVGSFAIIICTLGFSSLQVPAQTKSARLSAHQQAHKRQLASVNSKLDMSVVNNMMKAEIEKREAETTIANETKILLGDLLKEAGKHIGKPYRHGMKGPKAFDCSGFSSYVYRQFGYNISPSSRTQYTEGKKVDRKNLREGDLVFFTSRSSGKNVGHVGIVVSADNATGSFRFIHASIKGVKIDDCKGYYEGRYVGARRIIE